MVDQSKNLMIGLFVIAAVVIVGFILLFIHPDIGDEGRILRVRFSNIDKVSVGTRVTFGGKPVGEVIEIKPVIDKAEPRKAYEGEIYAYELVLAVDRSINVYSSDDISLRTSGLLGEKSVNITPMPSKKGQPLTLMNDKVIYADETGTVEETFKEIKELSDKFEEALDAVIGTLDEIKESRLWEKMAGTFANLEEITDSLTGKDRLDNLMDNLAAASENARDISAKINSGEGTVGQLISSDELYLRFNSLLSKGETTMNDVNHYGILFHLDKNWQRLRARRLNLMQKLCSPQQFRNFFNDEIDEINTSLSRVNMVLNNAGVRSMCCPGIVSNYEFQKVFSELLRRVDDLQDHIQLFNTQLMDLKVKETELNECCR